MVAGDYRYRHRYVDDDYFQPKNMRTHTPAMARALWAIGPPVVTVDGMKNKGWLWQKCWGGGAVGNTYQRLLLFSGGQRRSDNSPVWCALQWETHPIQIWLNCVGSSPIIFKIQRGGGSYQGLHAFVPIPHHSQPVVPSSPSERVSVNSAMFQAEECVIMKRCDLFPEPRRAEPSLTTRRPQSNGFWLARRPHTVKKVSGALAMRSKVTLAGNQGLGLNKAEMGCFHNYPSWIQLSIFKSVDATHTEHTSLVSSEPYQPWDSLQANISRSCPTMLGTVSTQ